MANSNINSILAPCRNRHYGAFYSIIILALGLIVGMLWVTYKVGCLIFKGSKYLYEQYKKQQKAKGVQVKTNNFIKQNKKRKFHNKNRRI